MNGEPEMVVNIGYIRDNQTVNISQLEFGPPNSVLITDDMGKPQWFSLQELNEQALRENSSTLQQAWVKVLSALYEYEMLKKLSKE